MKRLIAAAVVVFAVCGTVFSNDCRFEGASNGKLAGGAIVFPFRIGASAMSPEAVQPDWNWQREFPHLVQLNELPRLIHDRREIGTVYEGESLMFGRSVLLRDGRLVPFSRLTPQLQREIDASLQKRKVSEQESSAVPAHIRRDSP